MMNYKTAKRRLNETEREIVALKDQIRAINRNGGRASDAILEQLRRLKGAASTYRKVLQPSTGEDR